VWGRRALNLLRAEVCARAHDPFVLRPTELDRLSHPEGRPHASLAWLASPLALEIAIAFGLWSFFAMRQRNRHQIAA
jgi:hypothetical protein